ncbi:MAG: hypothetical protein Q9185_001865 [Variospora sp. 1 TL-2023]
MCSPHSFVVLALSLLLQLAAGVPQITAPPALLQTIVPAAESASLADPGCGGCILVADVAGIVWYSGVFLNTAATEVVSIGLGNNTNGNGVRVTRTSIVQNEDQFTFNPQLGTAAYGSAPLVVTNVGYESETVIGGATLTSPTAYNLFTAFTLTSQLIENGVCVTSTYESTLASAFTETLSSADGQVTLDLVGEQAFISALGFTRCQSGGENIGGTVLAQVETLTDTTTMFYNTVALAPMATTLAPTTNPTSSRLPPRTTTLSEVFTTLTATLSGSSTITAVPVSAEAPNIVIGNRTLTPPNDPFGLPITDSLDPTASAVPSGGNTTDVAGGNGTVPYVLGEASTWGSDTSLWGSALVILVMAIGWM